MYQSTLNHIPDRKFKVDGIVYTYEYACNYDDSEYPLSEMMDDAVEEMANYAKKDYGSDGIIGITFVSASTYYTDDEGNQYPDIIAYASAITFIDD